MADKPGRNEPCHCGSGSKYKKCCLENDEAARVAAAAAAAARGPAVAPAAGNHTELRNERTPQQQAPKPSAAMRKMPAASRRRSV